MPISLPALPRLATASPALNRYGADLTPPLGGAMQRVRRLGSRFTMPVTLPRLDGDCGSAWLAALFAADAAGDTVRLAWPQAGPALGTPRVNGANQAGTTLNADGFTPGATIPAGAWFSTVIGTRSYLYLVSAAVTANGSGVAALPVAPMLRRSPTDNAALSFAAPVIEGFVTGDQIGWDLDTLRTVGLSFTITEAE